ETQYFLIISFFFLSSALLWLLAASNQGRDATSQDRLDAADQFTRTEWFHQVVIGPHLQTGDTIILSLSRGEHKNRRIGPGTNAAADLHAIERGQHQIEDHQVRMLTGMQFQAGDAIAGAVYGIARLLQVEPDHLHNIRFILNHKYFHRLYYIKSLSRIYQEYVKFL